MTHKAEEGQKLACSASLAEIPLKHHPKLGQNISKIPDRDSLSEFTVSEEELDLGLGHANDHMVFLLALVHACKPVCARDHRNKYSSCSNTSS